VDYHHIIKINETGMFVTCLWCYRRNNVT